MPHNVTSIPTVIPPIGSLVFEPIRAGDLVVRLALDNAEIEEAQRLRYHVFCGEIGAQSTPEMRRLERDFDEFDAVCDHLLVLDAPIGEYEKVVGTYRLLRRPAMERIGRFYSESEFDIAKIKALPSEIMELGRSCVHESHRNRVVMQLLWRGIAAYVGMYNISLMFGCASFMGTDVNKHAGMLSYLYHYHLAAEPIRPMALPGQYQDMNRVAKNQIDAKRVFASLPTLIKGYLRLGGAIGDGAVIDHAYNTTDVSVIVKTASITDQYAKRYASNLPAADDVTF